jgi:hypothetical protein
MEEDLTALKGKSLIQDVIEEAGYELDRREGKRYWKGAETPELRVDVEKQYYYWGEEKGDVFSWLMARHGWDFKLAIKYLQNRTELPFLRSRMADLGKRAKKSDGDRDVRVDKKKGYAVDLNPKKIKDRRVIRALELGVDYPGDITDILQMGCFEAIQLAQSFPARLLQISGDWTGGYCVYCYRDFDEKLAAKGVWWAAELGRKNYELLPDRNAPGLYCMDCKKTLPRWRKAILLIANYLSNKNQ